MRVWRLIHHLKRKYNRFSRNLKGKVLRYAESRILFILIT